MTITVVFGAGGFIGSHLVKALVDTGRTVIGVDRHLPRFMKTYAHVFHTCDIRDTKRLRDVLPSNIDEVYQLCAFLGGSQIIDSQSCDADLFMTNMAINLSVLEICKERKVPRIFFTSSACVYANGSDECKPVNTYGWEKYAAEHAYLAFARQYKAHVRIGRLFNIYGPRQEFSGGRERVVAALCNKTIHAQDTITVLGNGKPLRSFLYIDDCVSAIQSVMHSAYEHPINIGSSRLITIDGLAHIILHHANKSLHIEHTSSSLATDTRACDTSQLVSLGWSERTTLEEGVAATYDWISSQTISLTNE